MRRVALLAFCFFLPSATYLHAQSSDQALNDFRAQILNQRLMLQNFSADPVTNFDWTPTGLTSPPPKVRTLGVFTFTSAKLHKDSLRLLGTRSTIYKDKTADPTVLGSAPIEINIAFKGADLAHVLPNLKSRLFFPTLQAAVAAIPVRYAQMLSLVTPPPKKVPAPPPPECPVAGTYYEPTKIIYTESPNFTDQAARAHFNCLVTVMLTVDEHGHPSDLWLRKPAGLGLDEQAIKAVSDYKFDPATCDGVPVKTPLAVEVNFSIR
jgi:hypothetical protein